MPDLQAEITQEGDILLRDVRAVYHRQSDKTHETVTPQVMLAAIARIRQIEELEVVYEDVRMFQGKEELARAEKMTIILPLAAPMASSHPDMITP